MPTSYYIIWYLMFIQGTGYNLGLNIKRRSFKQKKFKRKSIKRRRYFKINYRGWRWTLDPVLWSWV